MTQAASKRGVKLTSKSRPLRPQDLSEYQYIVGMDPKNLAAMEVRRTCFNGDRVKPALRDRTNRKTMLCACSPPLSIGKSTGATFLMTTATASTRWQPSAVNTAPPPCRTRTLAAVRALKMCSTSCMMRVKGCCNASRNKAHDCPFDRRRLQTSIIYPHSASVVPLMRPSREGLISRTRGVVPPLALQAHAILESSHAPPRAHVRSHAHLDPLDCTHLTNFLRVSKHLAAASRLCDCVHLFQGSYRIINSSSSVC